MSIPPRPVTIVLMGEPVPWARTRINSSGAQFTPTKQRNTAAAFKIAAAQAMLETNRFARFDEPVRLDLHAEFSIPASWSAKKRAAAIIGAIRPGKRPDIDNLYKLVADACNQLVYRDDALVVETYQRKVYGVEPKLVVTVRPIAEAAA